MVSSQCWSRGDGGAGSDFGHDLVGAAHNGQTTRRGPQRRAPAIFCGVILPEWSGVGVGWFAPREPRPHDGKCVGCCTAGACRVSNGKVEVRVRSTALL